MRYLALIITLMIYSLTIQAQPRYALVIGNSTYNERGKTGYLTNPVNDAKDMKALLTNQLGFTVIDGYDVKKKEFKHLIQEFNRLLRKSDSPAVALFYFSGHGFSGKDDRDNDTNYLVPLWPKDEPPTDQVSLEEISVSSNYIVKGMRRYNKKGTNLMVLDACRSSAKGFVQNYQEDEEKGSSSGGFVNMDSRGVFLAYATALGRSSYGATNTRNSIYTAKLLEVLKESAFWHKNITEVFNETAFRVAKFTEHHQVPWYSSSGIKFCFEDCLQQSNASQLLRTCQQHFDAYRLTSGQGGTALDCYSDVLKKYPNNAKALAGLDKIAAKYVSWIKAALNNGEIEKAKQYWEGLRQVSPESRRLADFEKRIFFKPLPPAPPVTPPSDPLYEEPTGLRWQIVSVWQTIVLGVIVILLIWGWRHHKRQISPTHSTRSHAERGNACLDAPASCNKIKTRPSRTRERPSRHSHAERGNEEAPDIVTNSIGMKFKLIKAGKFQMGSEKGQDWEKPVHSVEITKDFYMGIYQVTVGQYKKYVDEKGGYFNPDYNQQGDNAAVTAVSWDDAQKFISWLNEKEGVSHYRLPTEAQWEYSARAGTTTEYSFGDDSSLLGDYAWYRDNREGDYAHIVGQKKQNPWGLYDMHGNIWEWVQDIYSSYSDRIYTDPTGPSTGSYRVDRGGGWGNTASNCRAAKLRLRLAGLPQQRPRFSSIEIKYPVALGFFTLLRLSLFVLTFVFDGFTIIKNLASFILHSERSVRSLRSHEAAGQNK